MKQYKKVSIWSDGGKHFKSKEFLARIFEKIHKKMKIEIKMNFFTEYHGKSFVDGHFGTVSKWLKECMLVKDIKTINNLIKCFSEKEKERHSKSRNKRNGEEKIGKSNYFFLEYKRTKRNKILKYEFKNIRDYLSFFMKDNLLYVSYFSCKDKKNYQKISYTKKVEDDERPTKLSIPNKSISQVDEEIFISFSTFQLQMARKKKMEVFGKEMEP